MNRTFFVVLALGVILAAPLHLLPAAQARYFPISPVSVTSASPNLVRRVTLWWMKKSGAGLVPIWVICEFIMAMPRCNMRSARSAGARPARRKRPESQPQEISVGEPNFDLDMGQIAEYRPHQAKSGSQEFRGYSLVGREQCTRRRRPATKPAPFHALRFHPRTAGLQFSAEIAYVELPVSARQAFSRDRSSAGQRRDYLQPARDQGDLDQRGIVRCAVAEAANYGDHLRVAVRVPVIEFVFK